MADEDINVDLNADPPAPEHEGEVDAIKEENDNTVEPDLKDMPDSEGKVEESGEDVVTKLMQERGIIDPPKEEKVEGEDIPDDFTEAARSQGWTDEQIIDFAEGLDDDVLLEMIPSMFDEDESDEEPDKGAVEHEGEPKPSQEKDKSPENDDVAALRKEIEELKSQLGDFNKDRQEKSAAATMAAVDSAFDKAGEDFKVFGKTEDLLRYPAGPKKGQLVPNSPAFKARSEVYDKAAKLMQVGVSVEEAMQDALTWYKGKYLEKDVHRKLVKELKSRESKLSAKRSGKETVKTYEDEEEREADVVREAARRLGIKGVDEWR